MSRATQVISFSVPPEIGKKIRRLMKEVKEVIERIKDQTIQVQPSLLVSAISGIY
jgi:hypothetical protein